MKNIKLFGLVLLSSITILQATDPVETEVLSGMNGSTAPKNMNIQAIASSRSYTGWAAKIKSALKYAVTQGAELHNESELEEEALSKYEFIAFQQFKERFQGFKDRLLKFEEDIKNVDISYGVVNRKLEMFNKKLKELSRKMFDLHREIKNSTTLDGYKKVGMLNVYEDLNKKLSDLQFEVVNQETLLLNMREYYDTIFNKNICETLNKDNLFMNLFQYLIETNNLFDQTLQVKYNYLLDQYEKINENFAHREPKSFWSKYF